MTKRHKNHGITKLIWMLPVFVFILIGISVFLKNDETQNQQENTGIRHEANSNVIENEKNETTQVQLIEQEEAEYEKWLAATMLLGISMQYNEFDNIQIYAETATMLNNKKDSQGVYVLFDEGGKTIAIHSKAIDNERKDTGTRDVSSQLLGYATFDEVDYQEVNAKSMNQIRIEDLEQLIKQTMLVSIYEH